MLHIFTGESFHSLGFSYRLGERTISSIVTETCDAIYQNLKDRYLKVHNIFCFLLFGFQYNI